MSEKDKFYLTTPIYYANSRPHIGSAYTTIACDVVARYKRMCGYDVVYVTGTDEHGVNIERAAEKAGITPQALVDKNEKIFRQLWDLLGISYDRDKFVRTTSKQHEKAVQALALRTMKHSPDAIYKGKYEGRYCIYDNLYVSDTPDPIPCPICGRPTELVSEENYFFRLSAYREKLEALYRDNPQFLVPDFRFNEVKSFIAAGLKDISISRKSIKWGIPWPGDPEHVFYVWYDALTSYMTGVGFGRAGAEGDADPQFKRYWPADIHMMGKEIIRFHAVYWPAFLMAAGLPVPKQIVAHGWLLFEQGKMSKSKGNVAYPEPIVNALDQLTGAKVGNDALRYYLLRETVFGHDGNFSHDALITRYNADLANGLGNLVSRVVAMARSYLNGSISFRMELGVEGAQSLAGSLRATAEKSLTTYKTAMETYDFSRALESVWHLISVANEFLAKVQPWTIGLDADKKSTVSQILGFAANAIYIATVMSYPIIPDATEKIWNVMGFPTRVDDQWIKTLDWLKCSNQYNVRENDSTYPRLDKKQALEKIEAMENEIRNPGAAQIDSAASASTSREDGSLTTAHSPLATGASAAAASAQLPNTISIDDFAKIDFRVGVVKSAERIKGADKLLKLIVDLGSETRQILSGIAMAYAPEELVGKKVVVVANLAPRKMRGLESAGMILAASDGEGGKPILCTFTEDIAPGAKVK